MLDDLLAILETAGVGTTGVSLFGGVTPAPDAAVFVIPTGGQPGRIRPASAPPIDERPRFQIQARAGSDAAAETLARAAYAALATDQLDTSAGRIQWLRAIQLPERLGRDDRGRQRWVFNVEARLIRRTS